MSIPLADPYALEPGATRRDKAILPFKATAEDTGGSLSVCEFELGGWESGPVLHMHADVDEAFFVVRGLLEAQLGDVRLTLERGGFLWVPRSTAHTFANASSGPVHVLALATPGGIEELFAEQYEYLASVEGPPDPTVLDEIGQRHGSPTVGPPIRAMNAPHGPWSL